MCKQQPTADKNAKSLERDMLILQNSLLSNFNQEFNNFVGDLDPIFRMIHFRVSTNLRERFRSFSFYILPMILKNFVRCFIKFFLMTRQKEKFRYALSVSFSTQHISHFSCLSLWSAIRYCYQHLTAYSIKTMSFYL
jgi:hypothetical protein